LISFKLILISDGSGNVSRLTITATTPTRTR